MKEQDVLRYSCNVLTDVQRRQYFSDGFIALPNYLSKEWLARLRKAVTELVEKSKKLTYSNDTFVLDKHHSAQNPRLHRITNPQSIHPTFWEFFSDPVMVDLASDVMGPNVKFHHSKLNLKPHKGNAAFKWHQDIPAWPHTDYSPVTIGIYLDDCEMDQGPLSFLRGSHRDKIYPMYSEKGVFVGIDPSIVAKFPSESIVHAVGEAGTVVLLSCRVIHGSSPNSSEEPRPLLLPVYSSADSFPYTANSLPNERCGDIVRGEAARFASFDGPPCILPPDFRQKISAPWEANTAEVDSSSTTHM